MGLQLHLERAQTGIAELRGEFRGSQLELQCVLLPILQLAVVAHPGLNAENHPIREEIAVKAVRPNRDEHLAKRQVLETWAERFEIQQHRRFESDGDRTETD